MKQVHVPRWIFLLYFAISGVLLPWIIYLAFALPQRHVVRHWDVAWVGFDAILLAAVIAAAWLAYRHSPWVIIASSAAGSLLLADAWFDVVTTRTGVDMQLAILQAVILSIPLALISFTIAVSSLSLFVGAKTNQRI